MLSPTFAHVESELLDTILTISKVGGELSKTTTEPSVVVDVPSFGFPG